MYIDRYLNSGPDGPGNLAHLGSLDLAAGPSRFNTPGPTRPAAASRPGLISRAKTDVMRQRHEQRVREQEVHDRRQRDEDLGRTRRDR